MAIPVLSDVHHYGNKVYAPDLAQATIAEGASDNPKPRELTFENGSLHYRTPTNELMPVHENALRDIEVADGIAGVAIAGTKATITLTPADATRPGLLTPEQYALLTKAVSENTPDTLALRDADGNLAVNTLEAEDKIYAWGSITTDADISAPTGNILGGNIIQAGRSFRVASSTNAQGETVQGISVEQSGIRYIPAPPPNDANIPDRGSYAVNVDFLESSIETAINDANSNLQAISGTAPIIVTPAGDSINIDISLATETTPGAMSAETYALLRNATPNATPGTLVVRDVETGVVVFTTVDANLVNTSRVVGLSATPTVPSEATSLSYVDAQIESAIAEANSNLQAISGTAPIIVTPAGASLNINIAPASAQAPGAMSADHYVLLDGASTNNTPSTIVLRDEYGDVRAEIFQASTSVSTPKVIGLSATPADPSEATSVAYVQNLLQNSLRDAIAGMDRKAQGVRLAFDFNIPLDTTGLSQDNVVIDVGQSVLLPAQTNAAENGAYTLTASGLVRRTDSNTAAKLTNGASYQVEAGLFANHVFTLITQDGYILDTDPLTFLDISGVNVLREGAAIDIADQIINVRTTPGRTIINADNRVDIDTNWVGQTSIRTLGEVITGTWSANTIAIDKGGTGATNTTQAKVNLDSQFELFATLGDGTATAFTVTHGLNNRFPSVEGFYQGKAMACVDFDVLDANTIRVNASLGGTAIAAGSLVVTIKGKVNGYNVGDNVRYQAV